jgi:CubicO group peptidase (beta-lactamase class C family)
MTELCTPGANVAVIDNFHVAWVRGFGIRKMGEQLAVHPDTPFQAGSISKPIFALAMMRLCQDKRIDLDADVKNYLKSWQLADVDKDWTPRITLRQLLSHTAGTTVHGFPGYPAGGNWPSPAQVLDGTPPANTPPVFVDLIPGLQFRYSGGGTTIAQLALTDLLGRPFPELMRELVLDPLGLDNSSYEQPPSLRLADRAAVGHPLNGIPMPGGWHIHPEMAAAGLWTTAADLAHLGATLMRALRGEATGLGLTRESIAAMLRPQLPDQTDGGEFVGLGWFCAGERDAFHFGHTGGNHGFLAELCLYPATGQGAAIMINSNQGWPLRKELLRSIEREYCWPTIATGQNANPTLVDVRLDGTYRDSAGRVFRIEQTGGMLLLWVCDQRPILLMPARNGAFFAKIPEITLRIAPPSEAFAAITLTQGGRTFEASKVSDEPHG